MFSRLITSQNRRNPQNPRNLNHRNVRRRGLTILEVMVSAAILAVGIGALYAALGRGMFVVQQANYSSGGQENSTMRIEQLRSTGWAKVTDPTYIRDSILSTPVPTGTGSDSVTVTKEVIAIYPIAVPQTAPTPTTTPVATTVSSNPFVTVTKVGSAAATITDGAATSLVAQRALNFRVTTEWTSGKRTRSRETSTVISKSASR